jgi:hypothetical protein
MKNMPSIVFTVEGEFEVLRKILLVLSECSCFFHMKKRIGEVAQRESLKRIFTFRVQLFFFTRRREEVKLHKEKIEANLHFQSAVVFFHTKARRGEVAQREN